MNDASSRQMTKRRRRPVPLSASLKRGLAFGALTAGLFVPSALQAQEALSTSGYDAPHAGNPLLPGYFADPSILRHDGKWYIYATIDPWGGDRLGVWESEDFANWTFQSINWPTKAAATSPEASDAMVWAPSVIRGRDGRFWMYISVGSEVWAGTADHPLGPWRDANKGKPLIGRNYRPGFHMIDAEAFIDDDGTPYLYWGSGLNWVNGHCFVVKLNPDMVSFDGEPRDVTPGHYFEGPFMFKAGKRYFLTYSDGKTTSDTYQVRYAVGDSPLGPFTEASNNPILATDPARQIISPGHHAIFRDRDRAYILYHRQGLPWREGAPLLRQVAINRLETGPDGTLRRVTADHASVRPGILPRERGLAYRASASGSADEIYRPSAANDDNYATLWRAPANAGAWLQADLGRTRTLSESLIRPEFPTRRYRLRIEASRDGRNWSTIFADFEGEGSPIRLPHRIEARYLRLHVEGGTAIFEWAVR